MSLIYFLTALAFLTFGADLLVAGAARIAAHLGITPLVVGLTVVAFGTSAPELGVSLQAVFSGQGNIALGNVIGSNIFNVLLILGLASLIVPLAISQQLIRFDVPVLTVVSLVVLAMAWDGAFGRIDGAVLVAGLLIYTGCLLYFSKRIETTGDASAAGVPAGGEFRWWQNLARVVGGLFLLVLGARWLVASAVEFATWLGVSEQVIGLTIVAAGTSLPEVVTSVVASVRGERDIAVGNVVGSNLFNLLCVLGFSAVFAPQAIQVPPAMTMFDLPIMCAVAAAMLPMFITGGTLARWEGAVLFAYYVAYTAYLVMVATKHDALDTFTASMLYFVIPITVLSLAVTLVFALRSKR